MKHITENEFNHSTLLPHSVEDERALIKCILLNNQAICDIDYCINVEDFYCYAHQIIYKHISKHIRTTASLNSLTCSLEKSNDLNEVGGIGYLELVMQSACTHNVNYYAQIVKINAFKRELVVILSKISDEVSMSDDQNIESIIVSARNKFLMLTDNVAHNSRSYDCMNQLLPKIADKIDLMCANWGNLSIKTGFVDLDSIICGLKAGEIYIIAGGSSAGKTTLSLNIAENVALNEKLPVVIFSMGTDKIDLGMRILISRGRLNQYRLHAGRFEDSDWDLLEAALVDFNQAPIIIENSMNYDVSDIRASAHSVKRQYEKLGLIVVDDLQSISKTNDDEAYAFTLKYLKAIAKELNVPIVITSKIKKSVEKRHYKHLCMSDLRKSGQIEKYADLVFLIYRDALYGLHSTSKNTALIKIAEQHKGILGNVNLTFVPESIRFEDFKHTVENI